MKKTTIDVELISLAGNKDHPEQGCNLELKINEQGFDRISYLHLDQNTAAWLADKLKDFSENKEEK